MAQNSDPRFRNLFRIANDNGYSAPVGYVVSGDILCEECATDIGIDTTNYEGVMFSSDETDSPCICDKCCILLPSSLTSEGVKYVQSIDGRTKYGRFLRDAFSWAF